MQDTTDPIWPQLQTSTRSECFSEQIKPTFAPPLSYVRGELPRVCATPQDTERRNTRHMARPETRSAEAIEEHEQRRLANIATQNVNALRRRADRHRKAISREIAEPFAPGKDATRLHEEVTSLLKDTSVFVKSTESARFTQYTACTAQRELKRLYSEWPECGISGAARKPEPDLVDVHGRCYYLMIANSHDKHYLYSPVTRMLLTRAMTDCKLLFVQSCRAGRAAFAWCTASQRRKRKADDAFTDNMSHREYVHSGIVKRRGGNLLPHGFSATPMDLPRQTHYPHDVVQTTLTQARRLACDDDDALQELHADVMLHNKTLKYNEDEMIERCVADAEIRCFHTLQCSRPPETTWQQSKLDVRMTVQDTGNKSQAVRAVLIWW